MLMFSCPPRDLICTHTRARGARLPALKSGGPEGVNKLVALAVQHNGPLFFQKNQMKQARSHTEAAGPQATSFPSGRICAELELTGAAPSRRW